VRKDCLRSLLLTNGFIKRTLQLEGVNSLKAAVERSVTIKVIQKNSFSRGNEGCFREKINFVRENINKGKRKEQKKEKRLEKEIFVTYVGMEVGNVGNAGQMGTSDPSVRL